MAETKSALKFYQEGRSPSAIGSSIPSSAPCRLDRSQQRAHERAPRVPGVRRSARRALRPRRGDARDEPAARRRQRDGVPRGLLHAVPESAWQVPWLHSLFANAAAVASGVAAALRAKGNDEVRVLAQGGDGGTMDIGFACLSGMFERNDDVLYVCYDNEAYMNTGVQRSSATPAAARTSTTPAIGDEPGNAFGTGKNLPLLAMAHGIPYVATASVADLHDLEDKVERAMAIRGARYMHVHVPCPLGWGSERDRTIQVARLAVESGLFPLFEAEARRDRARDADPTAREGGRVPAPPEALRAPLRRERARGARHRSRSRRSPTATSRASGSCAKRNAGMSKPFAITLDVATSRANHTGAWRTQRPEYVERLSPCDRACPPARLPKPGSRPPRRGTTARHGTPSSRQTRSPRSWGAPATTRARRRATAPSSTRPCRSCRRALPRRPGDPRALAPARPGQPTGKRVLVIGGGPSGLCVPPTTWRASATP